LKADLALAIGDETVSRDSLGPMLDQATEGDKERRIYLRADKTVAYGELMQAMNALRAAGYLKLALVGLESDAKP
jgi:biopolymer transport protein ExbD